MTYDGVNVTGGNLQIDAGAEIDLIFTSALSGGSPSTVSWADSFWASNHQWTAISFSGTGSSTGVFTIGSVGTDSGGNSLNSVRQWAYFDAQRLVLPLLDAAQTLADAPPASLALAGDRSQQLTRVLRDALHAVLGRLQYGQTVLATVGSTAPFVGLLGTVWGIYHALSAIGADGAGFRIEQVAGPVGEALVMTAAGLVVAIPAVLAYNVLGRRIARIEADLEGFARDLRELLVCL